MYEQCDNPLVPNPGQAASESTQKPCPPHPPSSANLPVKCGDTPYPVATLSPLRPSVSLRNSVTSCSDSAISSQPVASPQREATYQRYPSAWHWKRCASPGTLSHPLTGHLPLYHFLSQFASPWLCTESAPQLSPALPPVFVQFDQHRLWG